MSIIRRITRLFKADLHSILDCLEEPEEIARQALREMEAEIEREEAELVDIRAQLKRLALNASESSEQLREAERQIELSFASGNEVLAKSFIRKRLEVEMNGQRLARSVGLLHEHENSLIDQIKVHREQLGAISQKLAVFMNESSAQSADSGRAGAGTVTDDEVEVAFYAERQKRMGASSAAAREGGSR